MKYTWGDAVYVKKIDDKGNILSKVKASIIWPTLIENEEESKKYNSPIGSAVYNVEFGDGSVKQNIPEDQLELYSDNKDEGTNQVKYS